MATFSTKSVLINSPEAWGMTGAADGDLKIPGFGTFTIADMVNVAYSAGAAATPGVFTATVVGAPGKPATAAFVFELETSRWESDKVRHDQDPGKKYVIPVTIVAADTADTIAGKIRKNFQDRYTQYQDTDFQVTGTGANVVFTLNSPNAQIKLANTGFMGEPYVEDAATKSELPGVVSVTLAETTAPADAVGLGKDLEENEFLDTAASVGPYAMEIVDRPIKNALYDQYHFDIPRVHNHEVMGAPDALKGSVSFSVYILKGSVAPDPDPLAVALAAIAAKA